MIPAISVAKLRSSACPKDHRLWIGKSVRFAFRGVLALGLYLASMSQPAWSQSVTLLDGRIAELQELPFVKRFRGYSKPWFPNVAGASSWITMMTTPAFCPTILTYSSSVQEIDAISTRCTSESQAHLVDYGKAANDRCRCVRVIEGATVRNLKALDALVNDQYFYSILTLVVTRSNNREKLRGYAATAADGGFRIFNEKQQPVCSGSSDLSAKTLNLTCFDGRVTGAGTARLYGKLGAPGWYVLGTLQLSDGARLDMAWHIIDRDLAAAHPSFPD